MLIARWATFTFKRASLFQFEQETRASGTLLHNVGQLCDIGEVATGAATRQRSDQASPKQISRVSKQLMPEAQRVGIPAKRFKVFNGTGVYPPNESGCPQQTSRKRMR